MSMCVGIDWPLSASVLPQVCPSICPPAQISTGCLQGQAQVWDRSVNARGPRAAPTPLVLAFRLNWLRLVAAALWVTGAPWPNPLLRVCGSVLSEGARVLRASLQKEQEEEAGMRAPEDGLSRHEAAPVSLPAPGATGTPAGARCSRRHRVDGAPTRADTDL